MAVNAQSAAEKAHVNQSVFVLSPDAAYFGGCITPHGMLPPSRLLKKTKNRLLTRAAQARDCVFAGAYRAATGCPVKGPRESVSSGRDPEGIHPAIWARLWWE